MNKKIELTKKELDHLSYILFLDEKECGELLTLKDNSGVDKTYCRSSQILSQRILKKLKKA